MTYVLTDAENTTVVRYPYTYADLRNDNPGVLFPASGSAEILEHFNVRVVTPSSAPSFDAITERLLEADPARVVSGGEDGPEIVQWVQQWQVEAIPQEEQDEALALLEAAAAAEGQRLYRETLQYDLESIAEMKPFTPEMLTYRSAVLNPSSLPGYPYAINWPPLPEQIFGTSAGGLVNVFEGALNTVSSGA